MNVPMPFQEGGFTYLFIVALSVVLSLLVIYYFRQKRLF
jgi:Mg2+ and Co2+ transporter CorA